MKMKLQPRMALRKSDEEAEKEQHDEDEDADDNDEDKEEGEGLKEGRKQQFQKNKRASQGEIDQGNDEEAEKEQHGEDDCSLTHSLTHSLNIVLSSKSMTTPSHQQRKKE